MNYEIRKIVVPVDFSPVSLNALHSAIAICRRQLATLTLIHVIENAYIFLPPEAGGSAQSVLGDMVKEANENLSRLAKDIRVKHDLVVSHQVRSGNPADEICRWALHKKIDLIVMGTHGTSGLREFFIGSNAYRVVKNSSCPVLTIPGSEAWIEFKKILFPIRAFPRAMEKYEFIQPIVRENKSNVLLAGVVSNRDVSELNEIKKLVGDIRNKLEADGTVCESAVYSCDDVAQEVLKISTDVSPDLIVISVTLDTSIKDFFLGPFAQDIVNHAQYPVLSIRPGQVEQNKRLPKSQVEFT